MNKELPKTKIDERTGIEYSLEGAYQQHPKKKKLL